MPRVLTPERMDNPDVPRDELERSLRYIRAVNRRLGGVSALLSHLRRWSVNWPTGRPVTLLDVATGSADLPVAARDWAERAGFDLRITGVDAHPVTLDLAREHVGSREGITLLEADALRLTSRFDVGAFDYVHAGLFLHHLADIEAMTVLRIMDRLAARGIIWNDLVRSSLGKIAIRLLTLGQPEIIRHDAVVSVDAGFTKSEALDLARRVGLDYARYSWSLFTHRFTIAGEKPGAWTLG
jgi:hypothetical protein